MAALLDPDGPFKYCSPAAGGGRTWSRHAATRDAGCDSSNFSQEFLGM